MHSFAGIGPCQQNIHLRAKAEKKRIAARFSKAATSYDSADKLQSKTAISLLEYCPDTAETILDLGCGTGKWTTFLGSRYSSAFVTGVDFSTGMLNEAKRIRTKKGSWCAGDIERLPFATESVELAFSNLSIQWCHSLKALLEEVARVLKPGGNFIFSTLTRGSMPEMQSVWLKLDKNPHINNYMTGDTQKRICQGSPFEVIKYHYQREVLYYRKVEDLLHEFKSLGTSTVLSDRKQGLLTSLKLQRFIMDYEKLREKSGIPCSYNVMYAALRKK